MPVVIKSMFKPITYDEIAKPLLEQTAAQREMEQSYLEANDNASKLMALANQQTDPVAYTKLKQYAEDLQAQADNLASQGLQTGSRRALLDMKRRYSNEINPIEIAATRKQQLSEEQRKLKAQNPDLLFERNIDTISLDDMIINPKLTYGNSYSGSDITKKVADATMAAAKGIQSVRLGQNLDPYTQTIIQQTGFSLNDIQNAIENGASDDSILSTIKNTILQSTGIQNWNNNEAWQQANKYANAGLFYGLQNVNISTQVDVAARARLQENLELGSYKQKLELQNRLGNKTSTSTTSTTSKIKLPRIKGIYQYTGDQKGNVITDQADLNSMDGEGKTIIFSNLSNDHLIEALTAVGIDVSDYKTVNGSYDYEALRNIAKQYNNLYTVKERVAADNNKNSSYDWFTLIPTTGESTNSMSYNDTEESESEETKPY